MKKLIIKLFNIKIPQYLGYGGVNVGDTIYYIKYEEIYKGEITECVIRNFSYLKFKVYREIDLKNPDERYYSTNVGLKEINIINGNLLESINNSGFFLTKQEAVNYLNDYYRDKAQKLIDKIK